MFSSSKKAFTVACIAALAQLTNADQPVHCFKSQIAGHWTFEVSREAVHPNLYTADTICTHELPNKLQILPEDLEFTLPGHTSELYLLLNADYSVDVLDSCQGNATGEKGNWTVVYDQAIVVELPNRYNEGKSVKFTANMRYSLKPEIEQSQYDDLTTGAYEAFNSRCTETMVGFKFNEDKMIQCWVGYQTEALTNKKATEADGISPLLLAQTSVEETDAELELAQTAAHTKLGRYSFEDMPAEARVNFAQTINKSNLTWKANPYLAQTDAADEGLMFAQTGAESYQNSKKFNDGSPAFQQALAEAQRFLNADLDSISAADMPTEWNWEDVNGYNFSPRVYDQGHCGSCYLLANNGMLESRLKIWFGVDIELSIQHRMDCSFVNEGCHGGWGFFDGLFLENYGAVEEKCAPYEGSTSPEGCARWQNCKPVAGVKDTYYVGQRQYGKMSEEDMIKEVRTRGPILIDFNAGADFQSYHDGILAEKAPGQTTQTNSLAQLYTDAYCLAYGGNMDACQTQTQESMGHQWTKLTHSTLLIGYGVEPETNFGPIKYWIVRNSYGEKWGESGNLKILRGENQYGCESENIAIVPELYQ